MKKDLSLKYSEINRLLLELRDLIPDIEFKYSDKTGLLEKMAFNFQEDNALDLNFFVSLPRSYPSPNLLRKSHPNPLVKSLRETGLQSRKGVYVDVDSVSKLRGVSGRGGKNVNK